MEGRPRLTAASPFLRSVDGAKDAIRRKAFAMGFDAAGFTAAASPESDRIDLARFLADGRHGDMTWLADTYARRADPQALWPEARSVIALGANYGPEEDPLGVLRLKNRGAISVYARNRDYHDVLKKRVKRLARWIAAEWECEVKVFVDTAPVMEKPLAARAGIGWQGKHTNLVSRHFGSWLFLAEVFTTLDLPPDRAETDLCGSCNRCREACPTDALPEPYRIDARRCISYLTIEHKDDIPEPLRSRMGNRIYGCDDCLAVCPWNKFARPTEEDAFRPREGASAPDLAELAALDDAAFRRIFAGTPIKRTGRDRLLRNVLIAIGNSGDAGLAEAARQRLDDASPLVREAARWAFARLTAEAGTKNRGVKKKRDASSTAEEAYSVR